MKVLVVDDDRFIRLIVEAWLNDMGHDVTCQDNAFAAIELLKEDNFDFIICDVEMPNMNGFELVEDIRKHAISWVPITFMSTVSDHSYYEKGIRAGGDFYLIKPLDEIIFSAFVKGIERMYDMKAEIESLNIELKRLRDNTNDGIVTITESGIITSINRSGAYLFGYKTNELQNKNIEIILPNKFGDKASGTSNVIPFSSSVLSDSSECEGRYKNGRAVQIDMSITKIESDDRTVYTCIMRDITRRKEMEDELRHAAHYDRLTTLPNRGLFTDRLEQCINHYHRSKDKFALLFIDLDHFKEVNDTFGHEWGDELLRSTAIRLQESLRTSDTVSRFAGDEFTIILNDVHDVQNVEKACEKVLNAFLTPFEIQHKKVTITLSIGIAFISEEVESADGMIRQADLAMYKAKELGRNQYYFYSPELNYLHRYRVELSGALSTAIQNSEFSVYYQPQLDAISGDLIGAEALLRWHKPETGFVSPAVFIPLLEDTSLIIPVTEWIIEQTCSQWRKWIDSKVIPEDCKISVNLSAKHFMNQKIEDLIIQTVEQYQLKAKNFCIEITESIMIADSESALTSLSVLKDYGIAIALDDFGTGYSSLSYLVKYPITITKIDHTFIEQAQSSIKGQKLVTAIINMSHSLGIPVIGEGVDSESKRDFLLENKCDVFQGFLYAPALSVCDFEAFNSSERLINKSSNQ
jgi:diguanylate cyclase (GGDEF)-like protein/PAS domain S-box-containing protein